MAFLCIRAASAERIDIFEAHLIRRADGTLSIMGGTVREGGAYAPSEVYAVAVHGRDETLGRLREVTDALAANHSGSEAQRVFARDAINIHLASTIRDLAKRGLIERVDVKLQRQGVST